MPKMSLASASQLCRVHVASDARGCWFVRIDGAHEPSSLHGCATEATRAAERLAEARGAGAIVLHDRYFRPHVRAVVHSARERERA
jgi:hypothetical protein